MRVLVAITCCAVLLAAAPQASAAIKVESDGGRTLVTFKKVRCFQSQGGIAAHAVNRGWEFTFVFIGFAGYHQYPLRYGGSFKQPYVQVARPHAQNGYDQYGNLFSPENLRHQPAGHVSFPGKGKQLKLNNHFAYNAFADVDPPDLTTLDIAGTATCAWRGKKPRG